MLLQQKLRATFVACVLILAACASQPPPAPPPPSPPPPPPMAVMPMPQIGAADENARRAAGSAVANAPYAQTAPQPIPGTVDRDRYEDVEVNPIRIAAEEPVSTFSI